MTRTAVVVCAGTLLLGFGSPALAQGNPLREAYFGETHVHTSYSLDAWLFGNRITDPGDAYKYFKGETIKHPLGFDIKIDTPIDFAGVTDHSEYVGLMRLANDPSSPISKLPAAAPLILKNSSIEERNRVFVYGVKMLGGPPVKALMAPDIARTVWDKTVELANKANEPGKFTAFCSYEWTSMPNNMNLHRNIFFKDCAHVPEMPFSALDSSDPSDLWTWMDGQRKVGNELLAISHNANLSDGRMYPTEVDVQGRPIDRAYAESRMRNEPPMTSSPITKSSQFSWAIRQAAFRISWAAMRVRLSRTALRSRIRRASTPTNSASVPPPTRTPPASLIERTISSDPMLLLMEPSRPACRAVCSAAWIRASRAPPA